MKLRKVPPVQTHLLGQASLCHWGCGAGAGADTLPIPGFPLGYQASSASPWTLLCWVWPTLHPSSASFKVTSSKKPSLITRPLSFMLSYLSSPVCVTTGPGLAAEPHIPAQGQVHSRCSTDILPESRLEEAHMSSKALLLQGEAHRGRGLTLDPRAHSWASELHPRPPQLPMTFSFPPWKCTSLTGQRPRASCRT